MARTILVAYATKHGSTREVADAIDETLCGRGFWVETRPADQVEDLDRYAGVVLGGSLYTGRWHHDALDFLRRHRRALRKTPIAVFALGPRTTEPDEVAASRAQLDRALAKVPDVAPCAVAIFGGVVDPADFHFPLNRLPASDARDWDSIDGWATTVAEAFGRYGKAASVSRDPRSELQQTPR